MEKKMKEKTKHSPADRWGTRPRKNDRLVYCVTGAIVKVQK